MRQRPAPVLNRSFVTATTRFMAYQSTPRTLLHPRHWATWLGIGFLRATAMLPMPVLSALGTGLGLATYALFASRRRIAATNIALCFPDLSDHERRRLTRSHFVQLGRSILATGVNWFASGERLDRLFSIEGRSHIDALLERGENVILLAPHFVALEVGGIYISRLYPSVSMYQYVKNPVMDQVIRHGRARFGIELVERKASMHQLVRRIRRGRLFYYLPDQDPGPKKGIFVSFFGVDTATYPMLSRFARMSRAKVVPCLTEQLANGRGWRLNILPALEHFPGDDERVDTEAMNRAIEGAIARMPDQYFWVHKRFKTRPAGSPPVY